MNYTDALKVYLNLCQRLDGKKPLLKKSGKRPGKKCGKGYIAAEKRCKEHYNESGKLTDKGKESAKELAGKARERKGMKPIDFTNWNSSKPIENPTVRTYYDFKKKDIVGSSAEFFDQVRDIYDFAMKEWKENNSVNVRSNFNILSVINRSKLETIQDGNGTIQALANLSLSKNAVYVDYLVTSPWNLPEVKDKRKVKGAGTAMIKHIVQRSIDMGFGGAVELEATPNAEPFYEKLGFIRSKKEGLMKLSPENAQKLLGGAKTRKDSENDMADQDLEYLEALIPGGVLAAPASVTKKIFEQ